jgi:exosortase D (VPLPA-CTERM-specific)
MQTPALPTSELARWHFSRLGWLVLAFSLVIAYIPFAGVLSGLFAVWNLQPEYSHGVLIPVISLFLIWRERDALARIPFVGSWAGLLLVLAGVLMWYVAELSTIYVIGQYAFLLVLYGLVLALVGPAVFRRLRMPLLILIFMIPLPAFFANTLSLKLQLFSSALGVEIIRLFGISVFLDGNVIDLGTYKLQVVEACDGLRYLFPLMTLAFIVAYLFRAAMWKRVVLFLLSIPIAILMNSLRIGLIGVTVEYWGVKMAEGVLHDFEGWVVFMISTIVLLAVAGMLARVGGGRQRLRAALQLDFGQAPAKSQSTQLRALPRPFLAATALTAAAAGLTFTMPDRVELTPARGVFSEFPSQLAGWQGRTAPLDQAYYEQLKVDDYLLSNYRRQDSHPVNVWVAYYASQRKGQSTHSPRSCLPGGGWEFTSLEPYNLQSSGAPFIVNRASIAHGSDRQIMYYWFQQRGRVVTDEYLVKWYIFWDALTRNRTDGALVRLIVPVAAGEAEETAERDLKEFASALRTQLSHYVPD